MVDLRQQVSVENEDLKQAMTKLQEKCSLQEARVSSLEKDNTTLDQANADLERQVCRRWNC